MALKFLTPLQQATGLLKNQNFWQLSLPDVAQSIRNHGVAMTSGSVFGYFLDHKGILTLILAIYGLTMIYIGSLKWLSLKGEDR